MKLLDMLGEFSLQDHIVVKLVPVAHCGQLGAREFCQWMEEKTIQIQGGQVDQQCEAGRQPEGYRWQVKLHGGGTKEQKSGRGFR